MASAATPNVIAVYTSFDEAIVLGDQVETLDGGVTRFRKLTPKGSGEAVTFEPEVWLISPPFQIGIRPATPEDIDAAIAAGQEQ